MPDSPTPLVSAAQFTESAFADLVRAVSPQAVNDFMIEATRACETECQRRLVPFTLTETHRAEGIDPDEYTDSANLPLDLIGTLGRSYAMALGSSTLVRHCWLNEYAPLYQEFWSYSNLAVTIVRTYGGTENLAASQYVGPEPDSGHVWFNLGKFIPIGSLIRVTYTAGYTTIPADLVRAAKYMAASIVLRELDPAQNPAHNADDLQDLAVSWLTPYSRA